MVVEGKTLAWEFSKAVEEDFQSVSKKLWQIVQRLGRRRQFTTDTVYCVGGELLTGDVVQRWMEYFDDLLNPAVMSSAEEAETGDLGDDLSITQDEKVPLWQGSGG